MEEEKGLDKYITGLINDLEPEIIQTIQKVEGQTYIKYDIESDTSTDTHTPNLIEATKINIKVDIEEKGLSNSIEAQSPPYNESIDTIVETLTEAFYDRHTIKTESVITEKVEFLGYDCCERFCDYLFEPQNKNSTIIAHYGAGYDSKFILQWILKHNIKLSQYIRQGSKITLMRTAKHNLRFIDSYSFLLQPLDGLTKTYGIEAKKGFFPHLFNTRENQNYIGTIPDEKDFGVDNMTTEKYEKHFKPWYDSVKNDIYNFKENLIEYCKSDVDVLVQATLKFRSLFKNKFDIDPFRYSTLASLCMSLYRGKFLPDKTIVANENNKNISQVSREWLLHLNDTDILPEQTVHIRKENIKDWDDEKLHEGKLEGDTTIYYNQKFFNFTADGLNRKTKQVKEFNGCFFHGCPKCNYNKEKYNKTVERRNILKMAGYDVEEMWGCQWTELKKSMDKEYVNQLEDKARRQHIRTRDSLFGGRTECFKQYKKCNKNQKILYVDVVSLYPTVNALDDYAVGFKNYININDDGEELIQRILNNDFIGLVSCDVEPPKDLYIPVLPDNTGGKLLFHLKPMYDKTFTSVELKKALEKGYTLTAIHSAAEYKRYTGLMKNYVQEFIKMKIENTKRYTEYECNTINENHKLLGFNFEIKPEDTCENPGLRQIAKLCLNSLWGKFGQNPELDTYEFFDDTATLLKKIRSKDDIGVKLSTEVIHENCIELRYTEDTDKIQQSDYISEITASFTTANARMRLYKILEWLDPSQIIYVDTDSCVFLYDETNPNHKHPDKDPHEGLQFGKGLGEWESEFKEDEYIVEWVCLGAKSYAYITNKGKTVVKQKGITLDRANDKKFKFENMKKAVFENSYIDSVPRFMFNWDTATKDIKTVYVSRRVRTTANEKRMCVSDYNTLPFGHQDITDTDIEYNKEVKDKFETLNKERLKQKLKEGWKKQQKEVSEEIQSVKDKLDTYIQKSKNTLTLVMDDFD